RQMLLRQPFVHRRRKQKPGLPIKRAEIVHRQASVTRRESTRPFYRNPRASVKSDRLLDDEILHQAALGALTELGGENFLRELIQQFIAEGAPIVERLTNAVENGDFANFQHEAHAL